MQGLNKIQKIRNVYYSACNTKESLIIEILSLYFQATVCIPKPLSIMPQTESYQV